MKLLYMNLVAFAMMATVLHGAERRIKDITEVENERTNTLTGIGLVTGLNGTGGQSPTTRQFYVDFLQRFGRPADPLVRTTLRNDRQLITNGVSVVSVTAQLPNDAVKGSRLTVTVGSIDDATDLNNGKLELTPLRGADGQVYAIASGRVSTGGFVASGAAASVQKNHPTTGYTQATVEKRVAICEPQIGFLRLHLRNPDHTTAARIQDVINAKYCSAAKIEEKGVVRVTIPPRYHKDRFRFISMIQEERVEPDTKAKVVINSQTGTVVVSETVTISTAAIMHGNISVIIGETPLVSQPLPSVQGQGETAVVPRTEIDVIEETPPMTVLNETTSVTELAGALNALGVSPQDLTSIFMQLHNASALHAELIIN